MPYLRLYSDKVPVEQKRVVAKELIDITLRTFHLSPEERSRITIQFVPLRQLRESEDLEPATLTPSDLAIEVSGSDLTEEKKKAFAEEVVPMLTQSVPARPLGRLARLLRKKADASRQVAVQFHELQSGAIGDSWLAPGQIRRAA